MSRNTAVVNKINLVAAGSDGRIQDYLSGNGKVANFFCTRLGVVISRAILRTRIKPDFRGVVIWPDSTAFVLALPVVTNFRTAPEMVPFLLFLEDLAENKISEAMLCKSCARSLEPGKQG